MKTIIKLLIMLIVLNAVYRSGRAAMSYYQLKDSTQQLLTFGERLPTPQLEAAILQKARELDLPVVAENVKVEREGPRTTADASYTQPIEFFPNVEYPIDFSFSVDAYALTPSPAAR